MFDSDLEPFGEMLDAVCGLLSRGSYTPSPTNTAMFFRALAKYPMDAVRAAFDAHVADPQRGRFVPVPADIIAQLDSFAENDGRPGADEAWAIAIRSADERDTVVWTQETAEAWSISKPVFDTGDEVGARFAFRQAYTRLVDAARAQRRQPQWTASLGFDAERREVALEQAAARGLLQRSESTLPRLEAPASLATIATKTAMPPEAREALIRLSQKLASRADEPSADAKERERTQELKAEVAEMVADRLDDEEPCGGVRDLLAMALARAGASA